MSIGVYGLLCPVSKEIKYVGQSTNIEKRFQAHLYSVAASVKNKNQALVNWLIALAENGVKPGLVVLELCEVKDLKAKEKDHIKALVKKCKLFNVGHATEPTKIITFRVPKDLAVEIKREALKLLEQEKANGYTS